MKCYNHHDRDAVAQCSSCGKALCFECSEKYRPILCDECVIRHNNDIQMNYKQQITKNLAIMVVLFIVTFIAFSNQENSDIALTITASLWMSGVPWGWSFLNKITPKIFLFMPIGGWFLYFLIKFFLSYLIGIVVTPYKIYTIIRDFKSMKQQANCPSNR